MKFFAVIWLSLFISVKSSTVRRQDGTFDANAKTNVKSSTARTQDGIFHENAKTKVKSSTVRSQDGIFHENAKTKVKSSTARTQVGTFHENAKINVKSSEAVQDKRFLENAKMNGVSGLSVTYTNDTQHENQLFRHRRSVVSNNDNEPCYLKFFVEQSPPIGFQRSTGKPDDIRFICQQYGNDFLGYPVSYFSTMFDRNYKIPVYSAYVVKQDQAQKYGSPGLASSAGKSFRREKDIPEYSDRAQLDEMYSKSGQLLCTEKGHLVPAETYAFTADQIQSTFTYTNAAPMYRSFNTGKWSMYEQWIRGYAKNKCSKDNGDLYLLTGTSDIQITDETETTFDWETVPSGKMPEEPKIVIPNSMWTAGCCVHVYNKNVLGAFAVIGNNHPIKRHAFKLKLKTLETKLLSDEYDHPITLFPGKPGCSEVAKNVHYYYNQNSP